jgi:hypothetical protein
MMDIDEELDALYRAARAQEVPSHDDHSAVRAAVASALAVTTVVASTPAAAGTLATAAQVAKVATLGQLMSWLCVGAALGGVASSAAWVAVSSPQASPDVAVSPAATPSLAPRRPKSDSRALPAPAAVPVAAPASAPATSPRVATRGPIGAAPAARREAARHASHAAAAPTGREVAGAEPRPGPTTPSLTLTAESDGLLAIQRELAGGDASRALKLVGEQDSHFRSGVLAEERAVVRVLALCAAGRRDEARLARERFLVAYPRSPHKKRVLKSCAGDDGSAPSGHGEW